MKLAWRVKGQASICRLRMVACASPRFNSEGWLWKSPPDDPRNAALRALRGIMAILRLRTR